MENENLFRQTYDGIMKAALGENKYFQMLGTPKSFNWATAPIGQMDHAAYQVISGMPIWSPVGGYSEADTNFFKAYRQILDHITFKVSPEREYDLKKLKDKEVQASNDVAKANSDMNQQYLSSKQNGGLVFAAKYPTVNDWLDKSPDAKAWIQKITKANEIFTKAQDLYLENAKAGMSDSLQRAIDAMKEPIGEPAETTAPAGWTKVPDSDGILRWKPSWDIEKNGPDWRTELAGGSQGAFSVELNASESTTDFKKSWAGGTAGYDTFFWGVQAQGKWEKMDLTTSDKSVKATINVKSSTTVKVSPGDWYDGGFISDIAKGVQGTGGEGYTILSPWVANGEKNSLFGKDGILKARVAELVVVYQPSFEIKMSSSTFKQNYQKFEAGGGLRIGPFHFGGSGGHESDYVHTTSDGTTFKGESTSEDPLIIGVLVSFPGVDAP